MSDLLYVSLAEIGRCRVCLEEHDLRCGACFDCSSRVSGKRVTSTLHQLWETALPENQWFYDEREKA